MKKHLGIFLIASLTLGLAPFNPEPHIWKQIMNLYHGRPMPAMDWFDLVLHGTPWVLFVISFVDYLRKR